MAAVRTYVSKNPCLTRETEVEDVSGMGEKRGRHIVMCRSEYRFPALSLSLSLSFSVSLVSFSIHPSSHSLPSAAGPEGDKSNKLHPPLLPSLLHFSWNKSGTTERKVNEQRHYWIPKRQRGNGNSYILPSKSVHAPSSHIYLAPILKRGLHAWSQIKRQEGNIIRTR